MPKFVVSAGHDAFVYYETVVEADNPEQARALVQSVQYDGEWIATGHVQEFDDYEIDEHDGVRPLEGGERFDPFLTIGITAQERDAVLTGLRLLHLALEASNIAPPLKNVLTNDGAHSGIGLNEIDALCQRINA